MEHRLLFSQDSNLKFHKMESSFMKLREDITNYWQYSKSVPKIDASELTIIQFYRDYVSKSTPVILKNLMETSEWRNIRSKWSDLSYLSNKVGHTIVTVDITPNGYGDSILKLSENKSDHLFILPEERKMSLSEFITNLNDPTLINGIPYLSHQNDSLRCELPELFKEVPNNFPLAKEAFQNEPEAINLWIGDQRVVSSIHKDHYENMYAVVAGCKQFTLLPPANVGNLYEQEYLTARYTTSNTNYDTIRTKQFHAKFPQHAKNWRIQLEKEIDNTSWIPIEPNCLPSNRTKQYQEYPRSQLIQPITCTVEAGEVLYLPAMWYHEVTQLMPTIAINYWHDMEFDCKYVYYNFVQDIANQLAEKNNTEQK